MSAYIVENDTINKIVSYLYAKANGPDSWIQDCADKMTDIDIDLANARDCDRLANQMFDMNVYTVSERYGEAKGEGFSLPIFKYLFTPTSQINAIKALECWKYQCMEADTPKLPLYDAMAQILCILCIDYAHRSEEYEAASWG